MQNNEFILLSLTKSLRTYWSCITVRAVFCSAVRVRAAYLPAAVSLCGDGGGLLSALHRGSPVWIPRGSTTTSEQNHQLCLYEVFIYLHVHVTGSGRGGVNKGSVLWMGYRLFRRSSIPDVEVLSCWAKETNDGSMFIWRPQCGCLRWFRFSAFGGAVPLCHKKTQVH